ncbi:MAG: hypothetical protein AAGM38_01880 [Pseudomonadota bacterium]
MRRAFLSLFVVAAIACGSAAQAQIPVRATTNAIEQFDQLASNKQLFLEYGLKLAIVTFSWQGMHPSNAKSKYFYVQNVAPGSIAEDSGLKPGDVFMRFDHYPKLQASSMKGLSPEQAIDLFVQELGSLGRSAGKLAFLITVAPLSATEDGLYAANQYALAAGAYVALPKQRLVDHVGFSLNGRNVVDEVVPGSEAELAGLRVGDKYTDGFGLTSHVGAALLDGISDHFWRNKDSGGEGRPLDFMRGDQRVVIRIPPAFLTVPE